jgi:hypothetical protein
MSQAEALVWEISKCLDLARSLEESNPKWAKISVFLDDALQGSAYLEWKIRQDSSEGALAV